MFKRFLATLLLLLVPAFASARFPDVFGSNPSWNAIEYVQDKGIVEGYPNGLFMPSNPINRAEFVKILMETKYSDEDIAACTDPSFKDITNEDWFAKYVCKAKKEGVIDGYPDGTFQAVNYITFAEAAKILRNTMLSDESLVNSPSFTQWYEPYVNALSIHQAIPVSITGFEHMITRQEMAEMIYRLDADLTFLPSLSIWEINDRSLIDKYYGLISYKKYEEAYAMKAEPDMTLDEFKAMYDGFPYAGVDEFTKTAAHTFEFVVMTYPNITGGSDQKTASERYKVKMETWDEKLKTVSSTKLDYELIEEITNDVNNAAIEWKDGAYKVYVFKNNETIEAASYDTKDSLTLKVKNLAFSPDGKYLTWQIFDWELGGVELYDIEAGKKADTPFIGQTLYGFTPGDKNFYFCSESGMSGGQVTVLDLPGFENMHELAKMGDLVGSCGPYDAATNTFYYTTDSFENGTVQKYQF